MKKIILSVVIMITLILTTSQVIFRAKDVMDSVSLSITMWRNNVFPSLFPFFLMSELLINYGFVELLGELLKPFMNKLFKAKGISAFVFIMSIISGFPSNAKYTRELYEQGLINEKDASKILMFSHFSNPLFILGTISIMFLNNKTAGLIIIFSHYIGNIIVGFIYRNYNASNENSSFSIKKAVIAMHKRRIESKSSFGKLITNSLTKTTNTLLLILGVITMYSIIISIINSTIYIEPITRGIISGLLEMTQGLRHLSILGISIKIKIVLFTSLLSFGGLSVHTQIIGILSDTKIKYLPFLIARITHVIASTIISILLVNIYI